MTYKTEDLIKTKRIVAEAMAIIQTLADMLTKKNVEPGLSQLEQELLLDLEGGYESNESIVRDIDAITDDLPPWDEEPAS